MKNSQKIEKKNLENLENGKKYLADTLRRHKFSEVQNSWMHLYPLLQRCMLYLFCLHICTVSVVLIYIRQVRLNFLKRCRENYPFATLYWVKQENIYPHKFSKPIRKYIFLSYWKQIYCLKLQFLSPNRHINLIKFSNINSRIKCKICSKLTIEAPDVVLEHINAGWNTLLPWSKFSYTFLSWI